MEMASCGSPRCSFATKRVRLCESKLDGPCRVSFLFWCFHCVGQLFPFFLFLFFSSKKQFTSHKAYPLCTSMTCPDRQHSLTVAGLAGQLTARRKPLCRAWKITSLSKARHIQVKYKCCLRKLQIFILPSSTERGERPTWFHGPSRGMPLQQDGNRTDKRSTHAVNIAYCATIGCALYLECFRMPVPGQP